MCKSVVQVLCIVCVLYIYSYIYIYIYVHANSGVWKEGDGGEARLV